MAYFQTDRPNIAPLFATLLDTVRNIALSVPARSASTAEEDLGKAARREAARRAVDDLLR